MSGSPSENALWAGDVQPDELRATGHGSLALHHRIASSGMNAGLSGTSHGLPRFQIGRGLHVDGNAG